MDMSSSNPPRTLGALISLMGLALAIGGAMDLQHGGLYFTIIGLACAGTGVLLFLGRSGALPVYAVTLATIWVWSLIETGGRVGLLVPRVALPTVIGLYLFFSNVRSRLA